MIIEMCSNVHIVHELLIKRVIYIVHSNETWY